MRGVAALVLLALLGPAACRRAPEPARDAVQEGFRDGSLTAREARGKRVFAERCATCHGREGRGDGQNAYNLRPPPPDFSVSLAKLPPADRRRVIEGGTAALGRSSLCPPWGRTLDASDTEALLAYLDVLARLPKPEAQAPASGGWRTRTRR
jgi:mono/diheme cytochrome c family protein